MKFPPDAKKQLVILMWCVSISLFLWYFAISMKPELNFFQYITFCILLFGGGLAYHVVVELIKCPYDEGNSDLWSALLRKLFVLFLGYPIVGGSLAIGIALGGAVGYIIAFFGLVIGMIWVMHFLTKLDEPIKAVLLNRK